MVWREYPSTADETFRVSTDGCYFSTKLALARKQGRVLRAIPLEAAPVNTFWDLGRSDQTAIWFHQRVGMENRFIRYYEASGEDVSHFVACLQARGYVFGTHYVPHDAGHRRLGLSPDTNKTIKEMLEALLPGQRIQTVPRITSVTTGIQSTRSVFSSCYFDETNCMEGLTRLANYRKEWDKARGGWRDFPRHDDNSNGADAFCQFVHDADVAMQQILSSNGSSIMQRTMMRTHVAVFTEGDMISMGASIYRHNRYSLTPIWCYRRGKDRLPYGVIRRVRDIQQNLNKRASKALFLMNTNQIIADEGAVDDWNVLLDEVDRPDGMIVKK